MNNKESGKYTNSMLQDIIKKYAPVNESNERKVDESAFDWTHTLAYLTQILSRAKEARQAQLILGEALTEKIFRPPSYFEPEPGGCDKLYGSRGHFYTSCGS